MHTLISAHKINDEQSEKDISQIVDYKVTMLIAAGATMAAIVKEAADALAGTHLSEQHKSEGCPSDNMKVTGGCCG
ncbi:MAG: hypothetical protein PVG26_22740 [Desulfobacterales bacterium]|jgi:hypothetical protein